MRNTLLGVLMLEGGVNIIHIWGSVFYIIRNAISYNAKKAVTNSYSFFYLVVAEGRFELSTLRV